MRGILAVNRRGIGDWQELAAKQIRYSLFVGMDVSYLSTKWLLSTTFGSCSNVQVKLRTSKFRADVVNGGRLWRKSPLRPRYTGQILAKWQPICFHEQSFHVFISPTRFGKVQPSLQLRRASWPFISRTSCKCSRTKLFSSLFPPSYVVIVFFRSKQILEWVRGWWIGE